MDTTVNKNDDDDDDDEEGDDEEAADMEAFEESGMLDNDQATVDVKQKTNSICESSAVEGEIIHTRTYDLHITYDKYYQTPRLWLSGYNEVIIQ